MSDAAVNPAPGDGAPWYTVEAAARYLGLDQVSRAPCQAVRRLVRARRIRATRIAGKVMFRRRWLDAYVEANATGPAVPAG